VKVANASVGVNTVLWNIDWEEGDVIVGCESLWSGRNSDVHWTTDSTTYVAVKQTL
jgi:hypothetical protein